MVKTSSAPTFTEFIAGTTATGAQIEFIELIVEHLTENGVMDVARLYESPFTDINQRGPDAVFPAAKVEAMVQVLREIRARAVA